MADNERNIGIDLSVDLDGDWGDLRRLLHHGTLGGARRRRDLLKELLEELGTFATMATHVEAPVGSDGSGYLQSHIGQSGVGYAPGGAGGGGSYVKTVGVRAGSSMHPLYVHMGTARVQSIYGTFGSGARELLARGAGMTAHTSEPLMSAPGSLLGRSGSASVGGFGPGGLLSGTSGRIYPRGDRARASVIETKRSRVTGRNFIEHATGRKPALAIRKRGEGVHFRAWVSGQAPNPYMARSFIHTAIYAKGRLRAIAVGLIHL